VLIIPSSWSSQRAVLTSHQGPCPHQQMILYFHHVILLGGPHKSEIMSIYVYTVICSNCKKSPLGSRFTFQKRKVVPFHKFYHKSGSFILFTHVAEMDENGKEMRQSCGCGVAQWLHALNEKTNMACELLWARLVACSLFWAPWAQALAGLGRIKRAKTSVGISFGGLSRIRRAKRPILIGCSLFLSLCEQSITPGVCLPSEGHLH
jgi:hypothetical protein